MKVLNQGNIRNAYGIELGKLKPTEHLDKLLSKQVLKWVAVEDKLDGQRYTLQVGPEGTFLTSRSRAGKTKGVAHSSNQMFVVEELEPWMKEISSPVVHVLDGELVTVGKSTSTDVSRKDTEKRFVCFDIIVYGGFDVRNYPNATRAEYAYRVCGGCKLHPRISMVNRISHTEFNLADLKNYLDKARQNGVEGYVLKPIDHRYERLGYGWKIKPEDTVEAFVTDTAEERKHHLGEVTRTGRVGTVEVSMYVKDLRAYKNGPESALTRKVVGWVPLPEELRFPLDRASELIDKVIAFKHFGWSGKDFRFPKFVAPVADKQPIDCWWDKSVEGIENEE